jgi:hypothetical protein
MKIINLDKRQYLSPEAFGVKPTLDSIAMTREGVMQGLVVLCADGNGRGGGDLETDSEIVGTWTGDRIVIIGTTACDARLSAPGLEDVPVFEQVLKAGGIDVSEEVIAAIVDAEGASSSLYGLPVDVTKRVAYRELFGDEQLFLVPDVKGKARPVMHLEILVALLNGRIEETLRATFEGMAEGANRIAQALDVPVRWSFTSMTRPAKGGDYLITTFTSETGDEAKLQLDFDRKKLTAKTVFKALKLEKVFDAYVKPEVRSGSEAEAPRASQSEAQPESQPVLQPEPKLGSMLPAAVAKIVSDTLAGKDLGGKE